jgi:uncharacterized protein (DUF3820 family)
MASPAPLLDMGGGGSESAFSLIDLAHARMPFGKFKDRYLTDLPEEYFIWFRNRGGYPEGKLGLMMESMYEIKLNGLEKMVRRVRDSSPPISNERR